MPFDKYVGHGVSLDSRCPGRCTTGVSPRADASGPQSEVETVLTRITIVDPTKYLTLLRRRQHSRAPGRRRRAQRAQSAAAHLRAPAAPPSVASPRESYDPARVRRTSRPLPPPDIRTGSHIVFQVRNLSASVWWLEHLTKFFGN